MKTLIGFLTKRIEQMLQARRGLHAPKKMSDAKPFTLRLTLGEHPGRDFELQFHPDESDGIGLWIAVRLKWLTNEVGLNAYVEYECLGSFHADVERFFQGSGDVETQLVDTDCSFEARFALERNRLDGRVSVTIQDHWEEQHPLLVIRLADAKIRLTDINDFVQEVSRWLAAR